MCLVEVWIFLMVVVLWGLKLGLVEEVIWM